MGSVKTFESMDTSRRGGVSDTAAIPGSPGSQVAYLDFMFNPALYSKPDIATLRSLCQHPVAARCGLRLREAADEGVSLVVSRREASSVGVYPTL